MTNVAQRRYIVRLHLNQREIATWILDGRPMRIGRSTDNDIVIDNLAVSRRHATIEIGPDGPIIHDNGSVNGLEIAGEAVSEALVDDGLQITIGKHVLSFEAEHERSEFPASVDQRGFEATIQATATPRIANPATLVELGADGEQRHPIDTPVFLFGKSEVADIRLGGMLVADLHAEIKVENGEHHLTHLSGRRGVKVNGQGVRECVLGDGDTIEIAGREFRIEIPA